VRRVLDAWGPWFWSCTVGLAVPFLVADVARVRGWGLGYSVLACVAGGGLIVGVWQSIILRRRFRGSGWWIAASAVGWTLAAVAASLSDTLTRRHSLRGIGGALAYLGLVVTGGLVLGLVTGPVLAWLSRRDGAMRG
jgi:hypothetical protein